MTESPQPGDPEDHGPVPFFGAVDFSQLMGMLGGQTGPVNWNAARQVARMVALEGRAEPGVDEADRAQYEELARAAQTNVAGSTALPVTLPPTVRVLGPGAWADLHLDALRPVAEALANSLDTAIQSDLADIDPTDAARLFGGAAGGFQVGPEQFAAMLPAIAPTLLGLQAGSMVGYLAQHALGRYDLPLPTSDPPSLVFVPANIDAFGAEWSLPTADLRFYLALHEVIRATQRTVPWVQDRLVTLAVEYVSGYVIDGSAIEDRFGSIDPSDPESLRAVAQEPEALLGAMRSPAQANTLGALQLLTSVLEGYADAVAARIGRPLIPTFDRIHEAMARHRLERGEAGRFIEGLLGLHLDREHYERGAAFCTGVVERAGDEGLDRLWEADDRMPTAPEIEAPGLWLARIDLPSD